jgi:VIT1/CCC1 family predicted Fe2+/Mn2+ transporter
MLKQLKEQIQTEVDTAFFYRRLAELTKDETTCKIFENLSLIEDSHAANMLERIKKDYPDFQMPPPSMRAKIQIKLGKVFGYDFILSDLTNTEQQIAKATVRSKLMSGEKPSGFESNHLRIMQEVTKKHSLPITGSIISKFEGRHKSVGGNALRAAVLGANDGLVSNMSLVMGVAGAAVANSTILLTGIAGLLAGAISMSLGEWLSVQSSRELHLKQIALEAEEMESSPEQERQELVLLYQAKGMDFNAAEALSHKVFENKETALDAIIREELNIDQEELGGSAWEAAIASFILFAIGAILPVIPFMFSSGQLAILLSLSFSVVGLFIIGACITLFTGKGFLYSGLRQVLFGLAAAAITYGIGRLIGVSIAG